VPRKNPQITPETKYWKNLGKPVLHTCAVCYLFSFCKNNNVFLANDKQKLRGCYMYNMRVHYHLPVLPLGLFLAIPEEAKQLHCLKELPPTHPAGPR
jgi:hypothetical protein